MLGVPVCVSNNEVKNLKRFCLVDHVPVFEPTTSGTAPPTVATKPFSPPKQAPAPAPAPASPPSQTGGIVPNHSTHLPPAFLTVEGLCGHLYDTRLLLCKRGINFVS